jgi:hypothetical protein
MLRFVTIMFVAFLSSQMVSAESYQRWIYWVNQPNHIANANDMADITQALSKEEILANSIYSLNSGVTYKIPWPDLYFEYIMRCVKASDATVVTAMDAVKAILNGDAVKWGNDIPYTVKNYFYSTTHNEVRFIGNYSGAEGGIMVLLINGIPTIKLDCGNPLEVYAENYTPVYTKSVIVADSINITKKGNTRTADTSYVIIQLEEKESPRVYQTKVIYLEEFRPPVVYYEPYYPTYIPFVFFPFYSYCPYFWGGRNYGNVYIDNSNHYHNNYTTNKHNNGRPEGAPGHDAGRPAPNQGFSAENRSGRKQNSNSMSESRVTNGGRKTRLSTTLEYHNNDGTVKNDAGRKVSTGTPRRERNAVETRNVSDITQSKAYAGISSRDVVNESSRRSAGQNKSAVSNNRNTANAYNQQSSRRNVRSNNNVVSSNRTTTNVRSSNVPVARRSTANVRSSNNVVSSNRNITSVRSYTAPRASNPAPRSSNYGGGGSVRRR